MDTLASINKIKRLRKERVEKVNKLKAEIEKVKNNTMYAQDYKEQVERELNQELDSIRAEYDAEIKNEISERERKLKEKFSQAEYQGLTEEAATRELLKEMWNQQQAQYLVNKYKGTTDRGLNDALYQEAKGKLEVNSADVPAYINAMKQMGIIGVEEMEQAYKNQNLNSMQKSIQADLDRIEKQNIEWQGEKAEDVNPFEAALLGR